MLMLAGLTNTSICETNSWKKSLMPLIFWEKHRTFFFFKNVLIVTCFQAAVSDGSRTSGCLNPPEGRDDNSEHSSQCINYEVGFINKSIWILVAALISKVAQFLVKDFIQTLQSVCLSERSCYELSCIECGRKLIVLFLSHVIGKVISYMLSREFSDLWKGSWSGVIPGTDRDSNSVLVK